MWQGCLGINYTNMRGILSSSCDAALEINVVDLYIMKT